MFNKFLKALTVLSSGNLLWVRALLKGVAPGVEHVNLLKSLNPSVIVDIGANRGQFSLAARFACPSSLIIAFEPLPSAGSKFRDIFDSDKKVSFFPFAIASTAGKKDIHLSKREDSSSLISINDVQNALFPGTYEVGKLTIDSGPLGDFVAPETLTKPAMLKLDVQGFEFWALLGCESHLSHFNWIYVECSFLELYSGQKLAHEICSWLELKNFRLAGVYNVTYDPKGTSIQADFLFLPFGQEAKSRMG